MPYRYILGALLLSTATLKGDVLGADFEVDAGYRQDKIETSINAYNPSGRKIAEDKLKIPKTVIYQVGAKARLSFIGLVAKAEIDYGKVQKGHYTETFGLSHNIHTSHHGNIHSGWTQDLNLAGGYLLFCNPLFQWGPMAGYSRNEQTYKFGKGKYHGSGPVSKNFKYTAKWQGPWLGGDFLCRLACVTVSGGYEYHWADWKASQEIAHHEVESIASKSNKTKNARGQVYYAKADWNFSDCFSIGANFKWQQWSAHHGKESSRFGKLAPRMLRRIKDKVKQASWDSWTAGIDLSCHF